MNSAYLFPGQGAQVIGMGRDIAEAYPAANELYETANEIVGYDLKKICFEGPTEQLNTTTVSQPAIFVTSAALLEVVRDMLPKAEFMGGLSLGEYTALYSAGVISFEDGVKLVQRRGEAMQAASDATKGGMVGIIGLDEGKVRQICDEARGDDILEGVNFNCPGQIVVSGGIEAIKRAEKLASEYGAIKAVCLDVAGAFHTEIMASASEALRQALDEVEMAIPGGVKIIANINAEYYLSPDEVKDGLCKQLTCPILWQKCMERLISEGVEDFYEIGPGRVLTGLMKRINRKIKVKNMSTLAAVKELV
ncbi:MAG: ACP S-malonyltransferase [Planctomycetota bacterium]|jgi:[acyl-carrier-protein] S-malonyltransferase